MVGLNIIGKIEEPICISEKLGLYLENIDNKDDDYSYVKSNIKKELASEKRRSLKYDKKIFNINDIMLHKYYRNIFNINKDTTEKECIEKLISQLTFLNSYIIEDCIFDDENIITNPSCEYSLEYKFMKLYEYVFKNDDFPTAQVIEFWELNEQRSFLFYNFFHSTQDNFHRKAKDHNVIGENEQRAWSLQYFGEMIDNYIDNENDFFKLEFIMDNILNQNSGIQMIISKTLLIEMLIINPTQSIKDQFKQKLKHFISEELEKDIGKNNLENFASLIYDIRSRIVHGNYNTLTKELKKYKTKYMTHFDFDYYEYREEKWIFSHIGFILQDITSVILFKLFEDKEKLLKFKNDEINELIYEDELDLDESKNG